jgi:hypothetical protein
MPALREPALCRPSASASPGIHASRIAAAGLTLLAALVACSPVVRPADFPGAADKVTDVVLTGPFDGQIVDASTGEPLRDAVVVGVWTYERGDGLVGPWGSETVRVETDEAGRYRIAPAPLARRGAGVRLVSFRLVAYKRGYVGYRSDLRFDGSERTDFVGRHNEIALEKWREGMSHAEHLLFLAAPRDIQLAARWERDLANLELYRAQGGEALSAAADAPPRAPTKGETPGDASAGGMKPPPVELPSLLDITGFLPIGEVQRRTGDDGKLTLRDLDDLERTAFYHGIALTAEGRDETYDVTLRVWIDPPAGLAPILETITATLPGVKPKSIVTDETWTSEDGIRRIVAFVDRSNEAAVLLTCGVEQCVDMDTAIILAKLVANRIVKARTGTRREDLPTPSAAEDDSGTGSDSGSGTGADAESGSDSGSDAGAEAGEGDDSTDSTDSTEEEEEEDASPARPASPSELKRPKGFEGGR